MSSPRHNAEAPPRLPLTAPAPYSIFNLTYYQHYFDVTTATVRHRCIQACIPKEGFINDVCEERVDLYGGWLHSHRARSPLTDRLHPSPQGPFWTLTTLVLTIYLSSSLSSSLASYLSHPDAPYHTDLTLLSVSVSLIYTYGLVFPALFWAATKWLGRNEAMNTGGSAGGIGEWSVVEALALWGYAMAVFVPVSVRGGAQSGRLGGGGTHEG